MGKRQTKRYRNHQGNDTTLEPQTPKQAEYIQAIDTSEQVICLGPAGTGKTYIAARKAAEHLRNVPRSRVILTRPNVGAGESLGYFPGTLEEKMEPWCAPVLQVLKEDLGEGHYREMLGKRIQIVPLETIRGHSFENAFIIMDEAQNATLHQLQAFVTRQGENSVSIINGDVRQTDLGSSSGLWKLQQMVRRNGIPVPTVEFSVDDCVRSGLCKQWIIAFLNEETCNTSQTSSSSPETRSSQPSPAPTPGFSGPVPSFFSASTNSDDAVGSRST